jgi:hypothetical protein
MSSEWIRAVLFSLAAGTAWGVFKELSGAKRAAAAGRDRPVSPRRMIGLALAGSAVCLVGLFLLTELGLTNLP